MENLIAEIEYADGKFPKSTLQKIIDNQEETIPYLLKIIEDLKENPNKFAEDKYKGRYWGQA